MTEKKLDARMQEVLLRYEKVLKLMQADLANNDFIHLEEHMKHEASLSEMIDSCVRVKKALLPAQLDGGRTDKKEDEKYGNPHNTISSIQVRIGDLKKLLSGKMKENLAARKSLSPKLKVKSPFSAKTDPLLIDITG